MHDAGFLMCMCRYGVSVFNVPALQNERGLVGPDTAGTVADAALLEDEPGEECTNSATYEWIMPRKPGCSVFS